VSTRNAVPLLALTLGMLACAGIVPPVTPDQVARAGQRWPDSSEATLRRGRRLYVARCSACHTLESPPDRSPEDWADHLDAMSPRARLTPQETTLILRYLTTVARVGAREPKRGVAGALESSP
jgi:mono/diheme cytochrome c family protein